MKIESLLGHNIKTRRKELGMTQAQLAESIGVSVPTIQSAERDSEEWPSLDTLKKLADFFQCTTVELFQTPKEDFPSTQLPASAVIAIDKIKELIEQATPSFLPIEILKKLERIQDKAKVIYILETAVEAQLKKEEEKKNLLGTKLTLSKK